MAEQSMISLSTIQIQNRIGDLEKVLQTSTTDVQNLNVILYYSDSLRRRTIIRQGIKGLEDTIRVLKDDISTLQDILSARVQFGHGVRKRIVTRKPRVKKIGGKAGQKGGGRFIHNFGD